MNTPRQEWAKYAIWLEFIEVTVILFFILIPQVNLDSQTAITWVVAPLTSQVVTVAIMFCTSRVSLQPESRLALLVHIWFGLSAILVSITLTALSWKGILPVSGFVQVLIFIPTSITGFRPQEHQKPQQPLKQTVNSNSPASGAKGLLLASCPPSDSTQSLCSSLC
jgi:hypothetical protein